MTRLSELTVPSATPVVDGTSAGVPMLGGRYVLGARLGEGGMGVVYQAHDRMLQRTVAVKIFRAGATEAARTATETQLLAGLNHPSLVTLFDAHVGDRSPQYLVMEYVDGPTLSEKLRSGPLPAGTVRTIARDIADALHTVHEAGIVHRDVKPSNVLLRPSTVPGEEFHAKLTDFGIAHLVDSARQTDPGMVIGSAAYLSPEQVTGAPPAFAADIYSLGLLLLESLTGRRAFPQEAAYEAALVRLTQDPVIPASLGHDWSALLTEMTARDPERRPTAVDVVAAVSRMDATGPTESAGESAIVTAYAATRPVDATGTSKTAAMTSPGLDERLPAALVLDVPPLPDGPSTADLENLAAPGVTGAAADPPRRRQRRWIIAVGIAIVLFVAAMTLTVGMLGHGVGSQAVVPPAVTHAATNPPSSPTPRPTPAPAVRTVVAPPPAPHPTSATTGTGNGGANTTSKSGPGADSGKNAKSAKNAKNAKNDNGKGKGTGNSRP